MSKGPILYLFAGPNGAGKTTYARSFLRNEAHCRHFLNADYLAQGLSPLAPERVAVEAGKLLLRKMGECVARKDSFAIESTLSGSTLARRLRQAQSAGYRLRLFYFWLPDAAMAKARVKLRVLKGGHNIPAVDIERRFGRSLENLRSVYRPLVDEWNILDGTASPARLIASGDPRRVDVFDEALYARIIKL